MVNRSGFIRIVELLVAVTLVSTVLILAYKQNLAPQETQDFSEVARDILDEVSARENLRVEVINNRLSVSNMVNTRNFINDSLPDYISFELRSCPSTNACGQLSYVGDVFSAERIISASKDKFDPIKLRLFLWVA
jgi:hypothetical protein